MQLRIISLITLLSVLMTTSVAIAQSEKQYGHRIPTKDGKCLSPVASNQLWSDERDHLGRGSVLAWDWAASINSPIFAMCDGVVEWASSGNEGGYGEFLLISYDLGFKAIHAHCGWGSTRVKQGERVTASTQICVVDLTGSTSGPHTHLEIHGKPGVQYVMNGQPLSLSGNRYKIEDFFDRSLMAYCKFCNSSNDPNAPIQGIAQLQQEAASPQAPAHVNASTNTLAAILKLLSQQNETILGIAIVIVAILIINRKTRDFVVVGTMTIVALIYFSETPVANIEQATVVSAQAQTQTVSYSGEDEVWDTAYAFMRGWEGGRCVWDPVKTFKGVTNSTYNAYLKSKGLGQGDVCTDLTEEQAKEIYYERYWVASGANEIAKVNGPLAIAFFDFAVNAGSGSNSPPAQMLRECGGLQCEPKTYNDMRDHWYTTRKDCYRYCNGWRRRVADIRKITE